MVFFPLPDPLSAPEAFVNVNGLLGFEVGDITTGKVRHRVEVQGFKMGVPKRHGCPSHGVGLNPNEKEVWVCAAVHSEKLVEIHFAHGKPVRNGD